MLKMIDRATNYVSIVFCIGINILILYVLFSSGCYGITAFVLVMDTLTVYVYISYRWYVMEESLKLDRCTQIEYEFGSTYRKRFYSNWYIAVIFIVLVLSMGIVSVTFASQYLYEGNREYSQSVLNFLSSEDDPQSTIFYKTAFVIPNGVKDSVIGSWSIIEDLNNKIDELRRSSMNEEENESEILHYKDDISNRVEEIEKSLDCGRLKLHVTFVSVVVLVYTWRELRGIVRHRAITL